MSDKLTIEQVQAGVDHIASVTGDPEVAHSHEDDLYELVLQAIADGSVDDPPALAKCALQTKSLKFPRWCA